MSTRRRDGDVPSAIPGRVAALSCAFALLAAALALAPVTSAGAPAAAGARLAGLESGILRQMNAIRAQHGLAPLRANPQLAAAAAQHSREMAARGYFAHGSADGSAFWKRIEQFYRPSPAGYWSVGENLLWASAGVDAARAVELWMASPAHRENILTERWREVGVSAVDVPAGSGAFGGRDVTVVTTDFGVRG
jgi:uncharacterized protein YkwD